MMVNLSTHKGTIDQADPGFAYSQRPFPGGTNPSRTVALLNMGSGPAVNAHASAANQAAAQQFVDFIARPKEDALLVQLSGGITQYEFLKGQIPSYLSSFTTLFESHEYGPNPVQTWWNAERRQCLVELRRRTAHRADHDRPGAERDGRGLEGRAVLRATAVLRRLGLVALVAVLVLAASVDAASTATTDTVTISLLVNAIPQPGYEVLIPNFERVYPNIQVEATYAPSNSAWYQTESTELAAGNASDVLGGFPGCGTPVSTCELAKAGDLAALVKEPWPKRSIPLVTSLGKYGEALYGFEPTLSPQGLFANDTLFQKLGLKIPQTFSQLLALCQQAKADGTVAVLLAGGNSSVTAGVVLQLAVANVYGPDPRFTAQQKAGTATFGGSSGWHAALQDFVDMSNAGCFEPGATGVSSVTAQFAQGQGLMDPGPSSSKGTIDALSPQFSYSFHPFPAGSSPNHSTTFLIPTRHSARASTPTRVSRTRPRPARSSTSSPDQPRTRSTQGSSGASPSTSS